MKILSNKAYNQLKGTNTELINDYEQKITSLTLDNEDYEQRLNSVRNKLCELLDLNRSSTSKDKIFNRIKEVIRFIEKGK